MSIVIRAYQVADTKESPVYIDRYKELLKGSLTFGQLTQAVFEESGTHGALRFLAVV